MEVEKKVEDTWSQAEVTTLVQVEGSTSNGRQWNIYNHVAADGSFDVDASLHISIQNFHVQIRIFVVSLLFRILLTLH